ncbi:MAG: hypothetical protein AAGK21_13095 [Bacteroidota bacterium]
MSIFAPEAQASYGTVRTVFVPRSAFDYWTGPSRREMSVTLSRGESVHELHDVYAERRDEDADGYGSAVADVASFKLAQTIIENLPAGLPSPEPGVDPDGEATLEWHAGPRRVLSVSVGADHVLRYAAILGDESTSGRATLDGRSLPEVVSSLAYRTR